MLKLKQNGLVALGLLLSAVSLSANAVSVPCGKLTTFPGAAVDTAAICDFTFTTVPAFACGASFPQTGVYTIKNNTPVTMKINYIRIADNDANPPGAVTITGNTCGTSLAAGASCSVTVSLSSAGPFSRILEVGVNSRQVELDSPVITPLIGCNIPSTPSASFPCELNSTSTFATLAGTTITNTGATVINGNLGLSPGTAVTGFPPGVVNGTQYIANAVAATAQANLTTLYTCLAAQICGTTLGTADLAGRTLTSTGVGAVNVYCSGSTLLDSGVLTLNGDATSVFIFQAVSSLTLNPGATIVLTGGATAANVFWQVGSSATLNSTSALQGTIAAFSSITLDTGATVLGRTLARNAAVTYQTNTVTLP